MYKATMRSAWAEINLINLEYNLRNIRAKAGRDKKIIAVVKADAYGHGAVEVAEVLRKSGVDCFAVSSLEEAITLREAGIKEEIVIFCLVPGICADVVIEYDLIPVISSCESAKAFSDAAEDTGKTATGFIAVDTGMGRIGLLADDAHREASLVEIKKIAGLPSFEIKGMISHFACADCEDQSYSHEQERKYKEFADMIEAEGIDTGLKTFANSAAVMQLPGAHYDAVRPGIILYGYYPSDEVDRSSLSILPVMTIKAEIAYLKDVDKGFAVSYGSSFITERPSRIATITLGYADGLPRRCSGRAHVLINGKKAPIVGNICMDQCMIDVTDILGVKIGDEVIVMGSDGVNSILADDIAEAAGMINYEVVCGFRQRLPKVYIKQLI